MTARAGIPLVLTVLGMAGCTAPAPVPEGGPWEDTPQPVVLGEASFANRSLRESSGVVASRQFPGVLWSHNDSGNPAELIATDTSGSILGIWAVPDARNVDWEDLALGPCPAGSCLYIGDVGDNAERRRSVTLYRLPEPDPAQSATPIPVPESLRLRYPDRPRDVEALHVDPEGAVWLVSKGRTDAIVLYRVAAGSWGRDSVVAERVDTLPIPHFLPTRHVVTASAMSPRGDQVIVRTYHDLFLFDRDSTGRLRPSAAPNRCGIQGMETMGEAIDWWNDSIFVLTSESGSGGSAGVRLLDCGWRRKSTDSSATWP